MENQCSLIFRQEESKYDIIIIIAGSNSTGETSILNESEKLVSILGYEA